MTTEKTAEAAIVERLGNAQKILDKIDSDGLRAARKEDEQLTVEKLVEKLDATRLAASGGWLYQNFTEVVLLEVLRRVDPQRAVDMAAWLNEIFEDGEPVGELVGQWRDQIKSGHAMTMVGPDPKQSPAKAAKEVGK